MQNQSTTPTPGSMPAYPNGFDIQPLRITYTAYVQDWAKLHSALSKTNFEELALDDTARAILTFWRDGLRAALAGAIGLAYMPTESESHYQDDIFTYITDGGEDE